MNNTESKSNSVTQIKVNTLASARIAQSLILDTLSAKFGAEAFKATTEIERKASEESGLIYQATATLSVELDLTKTNAAQRWAKAAALAFSKGADKDDCRFAGRTDISEWDKTTVNLDRILSNSAKPVTVFSIRVPLEVLADGVRVQPFSTNRDEQYFIPDYSAVQTKRTFIPFATVIATSIEQTASIDAARGKRCEGYINGRRYDSDSRGYKVAVFLDSAIEAASEQIGKIGQQADRAEDSARTYDRAAEEAREKLLEYEFNARKARQDWINGQIDQANKAAGSTSSYDRRNLAEYSAEGLSAGRLDIRTSNLTVDETNAILAILTAASARIATGPTAGQS